MKMLTSKWIAITVPIAGILGAIATVIWADGEARLRMVTALGVLVATRYMIRWIYEYGSLMARKKDHNSDTKAGNVAWSGYSKHT